MTTPGEGGDISVQFGNDFSEIKPNDTVGFLT